MPAGDVGLKLRSSIKPNALLGRAVVVLALVALGAGASACGGAEEGPSHARDEPSEVALDVALGSDETRPSGLSMNGLSMNGLSMNGLSMNGLAAGLLVRLKIAEGPLSERAIRENVALRSWVSANAGAASEILTYLARCALPSQQQIVLTAPDGAVRRFHGGLGLAAAWRVRPLEASEQELVSACLLAHVNASDQAIDISVRGPAPPLVRSTTAAEVARYAQREGAFYGNLFAWPPTLHACAGPPRAPGAFGPPGRVCASDASCGLTWDGPCDVTCGRQEVGAADDSDATYVAYTRCGAFANSVTTYLAY